MLKNLWLQLSQREVLRLHAQRPPVSLSQYRAMTTDAKKALRSTLRARLSSLTDDEVSRQSRSAEDAVYSLPQYKAAQRISIYLSMPVAEARTDSLVRNALASGKEVYVPYLSPMPRREGEKKSRKEMQMLRLHSRDEYDGLEQDSWGIPSLPSGNGRENAMDKNVGLDMIIVPGVAFDSQMNRIGHGAGFYDRFLNKFCEDVSRTKPYLVGFCLAEQILSKGQIQMEDWDWKVDAIAVGNGKLMTSQELS